jgi:hypothetical protein
MLPNENRSARDDPEFYTVGQLLTMRRRIAFPSKGIERPGCYHSGLSDPMDALE